MYKVLTTLALLTEKKNLLCCSSSFLFLFLILILIDRLHLPCCSSYRRFRQKVKKKKDEDRGAASEKGVATPFLAWRIFFFGQSLFW